MSPEAEFDALARTYEADLNQALSISGENHDYFARGRIGWLAKCFTEAGVLPGSVLDYGCGVGGTAVLLRELAGVESVIGVDPSVSSLELAKSRHDNPAIRFLSLGEFSPKEEIDVAYCNGVFHHIPVAEQGRAAKCIFDSLRPGGLFAFWENNPWNLGARWIMSHCAFDRDAVMLAPPVAANLLRGEGFDILRTDFLFFFPRPLALLRFIEPSLSRVPLGAQYMVLARKPAL